MPFGGLGVMIKELLERRKEAILERWLDQVLEAYPADSAQFLRGEKDQFRNPVGTAMGRVTRGLFEKLVAGADPAEMVPLLEEAVKIRSVQDFTASEAVAFVFALKSAIWSEAGAKCSTVETMAELVALESRIDEMALAAFDAYAASREKLANIRVKEARDRVFLLQRMRSHLEDPEGT
jgi:hypothetical protein